MTSPPTAIVPAGPTAVSPSQRPAAVAPKPATPAALPPRTGEVRDRGAAQHASVRAERWVSDGATKVLGDVDVSEARLSGIVSVRGSITADQFVATGTVDVEGSTNVSGLLRVGDDARLRGPISAGQLEAGGHFVAARPVTVTGGLTTSGHVEIEGDVRANAAKFDGRWNVSGELVAETVEGRLKGASAIGAIRATNVRIQRAPRVRGDQGRLVTLRIDAVEASLEGVVCQYVKADRIRVGADCHIAAYDGTIVQRHRSAHLGPESSSPRPHGITR